MDEDHLRETREREINEIIGGLKVLKREPIIEEYKIIIYNYI